MARKTADLKAVVEWTNARLADDYWTAGEKKGMVILLDQLLTEAGQYCGFGYTETYDSNNWSDEQEYSRQYYFKGK